MSLFKRPAWAAKQLSDDNDEGRTETNIFSHSHAYQDIVAEQERHKREKAEKKKAKSERRTSGKREVEDEPIGDSTPKRRRITTEEKEKLLNSVGLPARLEDSDGDEPVAQGTSVRRSLRKNKADGSEAARAPRPTTVIDLGRSSEEDNYEDIQTTPGASRLRPKAPVEEIEDDSDDEFVELARKARQQRQQSNNRSSRTPNPGVASPSPGLGSSHDTSHDRPPDPIIQLFITSPLPGTNPLIVHRKLSQPTGAIRHAWCQKQGFTKEYSEGVFFVHRMRRVYDVTTCRSLGLEADEYGNVTMRGAEGKEGVEKVHLEAVTDEAFKQLKEQKEREAQMRSGELPAEKEDDQPPAPEKEKSSIRVVLRAKGQKDFNLKVKPVSFPSAEQGNIELS